jgi:FMN phosphatase YigB (HAD superfamily)
MRKLDEYKAVIFDMDGTLYYQKPFRIRMMIFLLGHVLRHPYAVKDMLIIKKYREVREHWEDKSSNNLDAAQYEYVAKLKKTTIEHVEEVVKFYMHKAPLRLLPSFKDNELAKIIDKLHDKGVKVIVYSDYPAEDKLRTLNIKADRCYCSADARIGTMKPDPKGLNVILGDIGLKASDALMVGDRYEKDGLAAKSCGMDYIILPSSRGKRKKEVEQNERC